MKISAMRRFSRLVAVSALALVTGCATTTTTSTTWTVDPQTGLAVPRPGRVESVQEIVRRVEGNPAGGALAGALLGGFLFGRGPGRLIGAAAGAFVGAAASQGSAESRTYQVLVRFDDGSYGMFVYGGYSPFRPGDAVALTPQGLTRM
jgi:outer membrane lipoprotein SlyB